MSQNALKAVRRFCLDCQGGHAPSVRTCMDTACLLYPLRHGLTADGTGDRPCPVFPLEDTTGYSPAKAAEILLPGASGTPRVSGTPGASAFLPVSETPQTEGVDLPPPSLLSTALREGEDPCRPVRLIRRFCLACAGSRQEARACDAKQACALWSFRFGVSPATFKRVVARRQFWRMQLSLPGLGR